jgi:hypothetical protein
MSKFNDLIMSKLETLNEVTGVYGNGAAAPNTTNNSSVNVSPAQATQQNAQPTQQAQTQVQPLTQTQQPQQPQQTEQQLANVFKTMNFGDPNVTVQALNNAIKSAGNIPGLSDFFTNVAFDPKQGFVIAQQSNAGGR